MKRIIVLMLVLLMTMGIMTSCGSDNASSAPVAGAGPEGTLEEIIAKIYEKQMPEFMLGNIPVDLADPDAVKMFTGLDSAELIKEAVASESMMGSQAYSLVLVRVNDAANAASVAESMKNGIDQRKWICVEADDLRVAACGDVVMLVMISTELDAPSAEDFVNAFKEVCGGSLSVDLK